MTTSNGRTADHPIDPIFLERWSPRAFTGEDLPQEVLMRLLEAARWAPSSSNVQPWRFLYARRSSPHWDRFFGLLIEFNQSWCKDAGALLVVVSSETMVPPGKHEAVPSYTYSFDTGAAWGYLALQALKEGWHAHGMAGFDMPRAAFELGVPPGFRVEAMIAVGRLGDPATLPEKLRDRETPSPRKPIAEFAFEGGFPKKA